VRSTYNKLFDRETRRYIELQVSLQLSPFSPQTAYLPHPWFQRRHARELDTYLLLWRWPGQDHSSGIKLFCCRCRSRSLNVRSPYCSVSWSSSFGPSGISPHHYFRDPVAPRLYQDIPLLIWQNGPGYIEQRGFLSSDWNGSWSFLGPLECPDRDTSS